MHNWFLMHRVELKDFPFILTLVNMSVPNAPCGVESSVHGITTKINALFLMHRVELKGLELYTDTEPNGGFLMHRVELKVIFAKYILHHIAMFLMHRVELKDLRVQSLAFLWAFVPNAPCGVESPK